MIGQTTAKTPTLTTAALVIAAALSLAATSALAETITSAAKTRHVTAATTRAKAQVRQPASAFAAARGITSRASIDQRPDLPGYPPAQAAQ
jgi:hypothetical protein